MNPWKKKVLEDGGIHLELFITRRCNIKCKNCTFYCNINKSEDEVLYPLEQVEKDLGHLTSLGVKLKSITVMGGEPTMVKNLTDYLYVVRRQADPEHLSIFTNTVSLANLCNGAGVKALRETRTAITYTKYSRYFQSGAKNLSYLSGFGIPVTCSGDLEYKTAHDNAVQGEFDKQTLLPCDSGDAKRKEHFLKCECDILSLCNGRIYTCGRSLNIKYLNKRFGFNYPEDSYIEVSSLTSADELFAFSTTPGNLCSFCANVDPANTRKAPWSQEPAAITDYVDK